jgi:hypothetical protein
VEAGKCGGNGDTNDAVRRSTASTDSGGRAFEVLDDAQGGEIATTTTSESSHSRFARSSHGRARQLPRERPRDPARGAQTVEAIHALGASARFLAADLNDAASVTRLAIASFDAMFAANVRHGDTALRLAHFFGTSPQFWLNLQNLYEIRLAEEKSGKAIKNLPSLKSVEGRDVVVLDTVDAEPMTPGVLLSERGAQVRRVHPKSARTDYPVGAA